MFLNNRLSVSADTFSIGASLLLSSKQPDEAQHARVLQLFLKLEINSNNKFSIIYYYIPES